MTRWDRFIMLDWSGGNDRGAKPKKDAIWAGFNDADPIYFRNRSLAEDWLARIIETALADNKRLFIGFDFPFGYPAGFARHLTGSDDPFSVWDWLDQRITDAPDENNRFDVAAAINAQFPGVGPFWGNGLKRDVPHLPRKGGARQGHGMNERRMAETQAKGAFALWQLSGAGAVGSQTLMGLPVLNRLRKQYPVAVWPFEALDKPIAFVEIWPSLSVSSVPDGWIKDAWQVTDVARTLGELAPDLLDQMLDVDAPEEGWILGLGFEAYLRAPAPPKLTNDCFALPPGVDWAPISEALDLLRRRLEPIRPVQDVSLMQAAGRVLAADHAAARAHPPAPNTAVDGYGFAGARPAGAHILPLVAQSATAGHSLNVAVPAGHAIRILTGAALPEGVDTVILQEDVTTGAGKIAFNGPVKAGANTRKAGEDVEAGARILKQGHRLKPADLGLLAAVGVSKARVYEPLRVGVLSTGNEIVAPGAPATPTQVFDANRPLLLDLIRRLGHTPVDLGHVPDDRGALRDRLDCAEADAILTSGGASSGDEDHVSALLSEAGAMALWRIAVKPGRPLALGLWRGRPVFGLPGNPVAAMVCTLVFARPALAVLAGEDWPEPMGYDLPAGFTKKKKHGRREFLRARVRGGQVEVFPSEGSGRVSGLSWAEGLVDLPHEALTITPGTPVRFIPWSGFGL